MEETLLEKAVDAAEKIPFKKIALIAVGSVVLYNFGLGMYEEYMKIKAEKAEKEKAETVEQAKEPDLQEAVQ